MCNKLLKKININMSLTIGEVLENSEYNLNEATMPFQIELGKQQLANYRIAKELGANDDDDWYEWAEKVEAYKNK